MQPAAIQQPGFLPPGEVPTQIEITIHPASAEPASGSFSPNENSLFSHPGKPTNLYLEIPRISLSLVRRDTEEGEGSGEDAAQESASSRSQRAQDKALSRRPFSLHSPTQVFELSPSVVTSPQAITSISTSPVMAPSTTTTPSPGSQSHLSPSLSQQKPSLSSVQIAEIAEKVVNALGPRFHEGVVGKKTDSLRPPFSPLAKESVKHVREQFDFTGAARPVEEVETTALAVAQVAYDKSRGRSLVYPEAPKSILQQHVKQKTKLNLNEPFAAVPAEKKDYDVKEIEKPGTKPLLEEKKDKTPEAQNKKKSRCCGCVIL